MYCNKCGTQMKDGQIECENCGTANPTANQLENAHFVKPTESLGTVSDTEPSSQNDSVTYDYKTVEANSRTALEVADCYESLGWELANKNDSYISSTTALNFRRNRKIKNKDKLSRLQVKLDDCINGIGVMEKRKTQTAIIASVIVGIIGALIFGGGMCLSMPGVLQPTHDLWMYIVGGVLAAIGTVLCILAYTVYKKIRAKNTTSMNILIDKKRDEISQICEDAQKLLAL